MKYVGSKNNFAKEIVPIIQSYINDRTNNYIEPFVGGANIIDKINHHSKIGYDIHKYLIALLVHARDNEIRVDTISKEEYSLVKNNMDKYKEWYVGLVGFCASYNGKWFGGYAGNCNTKQGIRNYDTEAINNITKQSKNLKNIRFVNKSFLEIDVTELKNCVIYCDIPYKDTTTYKTPEFPYDEFYKWCRMLSKENTVLISEYNMPSDFKCIWEKEYKTTLDKSSRGIRTEKLFIIK